LYLLVSSGVNATESVWLPAARTVPPAGVYANFPFTFAVASSCAEPSGVVSSIAAGWLQAMTGVVFAGFDPGPEPEADWTFTLLQDVRRIEAAATGSKKKEPPKRIVISPRVGTVLAFASMSHIAKKWF
jgi:hypothetical protein